MKLRICLAIYGAILLLAISSMAKSEKKSLLKKHSFNSNKIVNSGEKRHTMKSKNKNRKRKRKEHKNKRKENKNGKKSKLKRKTKFMKKKHIESRKKDKMIDVGLCVESSVSVMRKWKDVVGNFQKQKKRIQKQTSIAIKKFGKKSIFGPIALKLILAGGGNKAQLTCGGSTDSPGAKQLANLTSTLLQCEQEVNAFCSPQNFPTPDFVLLEICSLHIKNFEQEASRCMGLSKGSSAEAACDCWTGEDMTRFSDAVQQCKIQDVGSIANGLKNCTGVFSKCRKYEDSVISTIQSCPQTSDQLKATITILQSNKKALEAVQNVINVLTNSTDSRQSESTCGVIVDFITNSKFSFQHLLSFLNCYLINTYIFSF